MTNPTPTPARIRRRVPAQFTYAPRDPWAETQVPVQAPEEVRRLSRCVLELLRKYGSLQKRDLREMLHGTRHLSDVLRHLSARGDAAVQGRTVHLRR